MAGAAVAPGAVCILASTPTAGRSWRRWSEPQFTDNAALPLLLEQVEYPIARVIG